MRTFKLQTQVSADGYMAGPNGEMDWVSHPWSSDLSSYVDALTKPVDCIVLGRKLAEGFIPHWASQPEGEQQSTIDKFNTTPKVVISDSLTESPWENATVKGGDLVETINQLKDQPGGDIIAYGGGTLVSALLAANLVDDIHLFVNPTAIGKGMPVFTPQGYQQLELVTATSFACGMAVVNYRPRP
ncbi:dihydrofolate reductase family protein [Natronoglycomyces albus]|uniref:Dihydrofolate reductase family protein n=1 Tax=Natronoglycomyces albus TaxID=2811108 RepID=A0A895XHU4_9ACTN|nr:dihydrofolate reductase family protein [Natronoglycomyces albus]QSB04904.1 dihydrofolate reductase family protein [Natronoglycomyces albus]